jgi:ketosteroid isomerase-like protein
MSDLSVSSDDMELELNHAAVKRHWRAFANRDLAREHEIYHDDAELEYPQSGELIAGRANIEASRALQPDRGRIEQQHILGQGDLWVSEFMLVKDGQHTNVVSIMEFRDGKVFREAEYFAEPYKAPGWRAKFVTTGSRKG